MIDYENILAYKADFRVKYKFRSPDDGGRKTGEPYQGIRSDFSFIDSDDLCMIYPEFEDCDSDKPVPNSGYAKMFIITSNTRTLLYDKIKVGVKGYFREGPMISADCEIIEILNLKENGNKIF
jgi:hypothetical protein